ncbi:GAF domain-containing sensor histidine kinase [Asticcacaulis sp. YBE204]|uniref:GAF domain-containing sensor histidine kinase n=1 Tax=Asticcacaulis sp. YBE204 TaxID=1282363 RepID=UPI000413BE4C|nr:GAF domain-containing sensor histidine kinase [Asticcacaulis sp. YBE204]
MNPLDKDIAAIARIDAVPTILDVVCRTTGMGFAAIARVTDEKWIACATRDDIGFGLKPGGELELRSTICDEIRQSGQGVIIDEVAADPYFVTHHTPLQYGFQSYISLPIHRADGSFFGTLCAIDPKPAKLNTPETIGMFRMFADLIAFHLDTQDKAEASALELAEHRATGELREQFIAVLGHDLRNPLAAIASGSHLLDMPLPEDRQKTVIAMIRTSAARMAGLIDNILDFARGRMGSGVGIDLERQPVQPVLEQVVSELRMAAPDRVIETHYDLPQPVTCDAKRLAQLFSNLLGNALTHGAPDQPVRVSARTENGHFILSIANGGEAIPEAARARLFQPFARGEVKPGQQGLGLGLYIASEIASAHGGSLSVASDAAETRFTLDMPA